jgi:hypothetical protein
MATIVTRTGKGSALTFAEGDANFTNLNNDKLENITNESVGDLSDVDTTTVSPTDGQVLTWDNATSVWMPMDTGAPTVLSANLNASGFEITDAQLDNYKEVIYTGGTTTGTITPDVANGNVQVITLSGNITFNAFSNAETGQSMTLIVKQPSSGGPYTLTTTMKFAGGTKTLSTAADAIDIISVFYDGTTYYASLATNFS